MRSTPGSPTVRIWSRNASSYCTSAPYDRVGVTATARGRQPRRSAGLLDLLEVGLAELAVAGPLEVDVDALRADVAAPRQAADVRHAERQLSEPSERRGLGEGDVGAERVGRVHEADVLLRVRAPQRRVDAVAKTGTDAAASCCPLAPLTMP